MLEILLLVYLCSNISKIAERKEQSKRKWVIQTILYWLTAEFTILFFIILMFRLEDLRYLIIIGPLGGFLGYLLVKKKLEELPEIR